MTISSLIFVFASILVLTFVWQTLSETPEFDQAEWERQMEEGKKQWQQVADRMNAMRKGDRSEFGEMNRRGFPRTGSKYSPKHYNPQANFKDKLAELQKKHSAQV